MYCTNDLRRALYDFEFKPEASGDAARSVTRQLQELFGDMQLSARQAVYTSRLTRSFGWDGDQAFVQNDVHECMSVLFDAIQRETAGSGAAEHVRSGQVGCVEYYTTCCGCGGTSTRREDFTSIMLPVRGCADVASSLAAYTAEEVLSGDNKYACETCASKQEAKRGIRLPASGLPPTLYLQLNRFEFDYATMARRKVSDVCRPAVELDLSGLLHAQAAAPAAAGAEGAAAGCRSGGVTEEHSPAASGAGAAPAEAAAGGSGSSRGGSDAAACAGSSSSKAQAPPSQQQLPAPLYDLYAVLMHTGAATAGHYFAYIRTGAAGWLHFNDSSVTRIPQDLLHRALGQKQQAAAPAHADGCAASPASPEAAAASSGAAAVPAPVPAGGSGRAGTGTGHAGAAGHAGSPGTIQDGAVGAYMLVYRRRDAVAPLLAEVPAEAVPADIAARVRADNDKYLAARAEWEAEQRRLRLRLHYTRGQLDPYCVGLQGADAGGAAAEGGGVGPAPAPADPSALCVAEVIVPDDSDGEAMLRLALEQALAQHAARFYPHPAPAAPAAAAAAAAAAPAEAGKGAAAAAAPAGARVLPLPPLGLFRLRHYSPIKGLALAPLDAASAAATALGEQGAAVSEPAAPRPVRARDLGLSGGSCLSLETRPSAAQPWPTWLPGSLPLRVVLADPAAGGYGPPVEVLLPPGSHTVGALRAAAGAALAACAEEALRRAGREPDSVLRLEGGGGPCLRLLTLRQDSEDPAAVLADDEAPLCELLLPAGAAPAPSPQRGGAAAATAAGASDSSSSAGQPAASGPGAAAPATDAAPDATSTPVTAAAAAPAPRALRLGAGDTVHCELVPASGEGSDPRSAAGSAAVAAWDANINTVTVAFNVPDAFVASAAAVAALDSGGGGSASVAALASGGSVRLDQRLSLSHLKAAIAAQLGAREDEFKVRRAAGGLEFKDPSASLSYYCLLGGGSVWVEAGRPLTVDEFDFKVCLQLRQPAPIPAAPAAPASGPPKPAVRASALAAALAARGSGSAGPGVTGAAAAASASAAPAAGGAAGSGPKYLPLGTLALRCGDSGAQLKQQLFDWLRAHPGLQAAQAADAEEGLVPALPPSPAYLRLREKPLNASKLGRVLVDDRSLLESYGGRLNDGKELAVQVTAHPEVAAEGDMLLTAVRWQPRDGSLAVAEEAVFAASSTLRQVAATLAQRFGLAAEAVAGGLRLGKPWAWQLADPANMWQLKWLEVQEKGHAGSSSAPAAPVPEAGAAGAEGAAPAGAPAGPAPAPACDPADEPIGKCKWGLKTGDYVALVAQAEWDDPAGVGKPAPKAGAGSEGGGAGGGGAARRWGGGGREEAFKIYTPAEQVAREAQKAAAEATLKAEADERAATLKAALAARAAPGAADGAPAPGDAAAGAARRPPPLPGSSGGPPIDDGVSAPFPGGGAFCEGADKYLRLLQLGLTPEAVRAMMRADGIDPDGLLPAPGAT